MSIDASTTVGSMVHPHWDVACRCSKTGTGECYVSACPGQLMELEVTHERCRLTRHNS